jgi:hypothetical protein
MNRAIMRNDPRRHCGAPMIVIDILERTAPIRAPPMQGRP